MELENRYLNYTEYQELGGTLEGTPFNSFEYKAEMEINKPTFNRLVSLEEIPQEVKMCTFELINLIFSQDKALKHSGVESENTDGYSVKYSSENTKTYTDNVKEIIKTYLSNVVIIIDDKEIPVLYRGVK